MPDLTTGITLGILGGGQLGRMSAMAAARLGIKVITYCPEINSPASFVSAKTINGEYSDQKSLAQFSKNCDFITYEFENIPIETIDYLESLNTNSVFPSRKLLEVSQDRVKEKSFLNQLGIETAIWRNFETFVDLQNLKNDLPFEEFIIKTARFGYDGKGQIKSSRMEIKENSKLQQFIEQNSQSGFILESLIPFTNEISVIIARDINGKTVTYGPMLNEHNNHILSKTIIPAHLTKSQTETAIKLAEKIADSISLRGVLTVEMFLQNDGHILVNEIAPRTHNSGHWTIDACAVSQFEQHVRAVCGLNIGSSARHSNAMMLNLIGDDARSIEQFLEQENTCLHLYGKTEIKDGRKMGHITILSPYQDDK